MNRKFHKAVALLLVTVMVLSAVPAFAAKKKRQQTQNNSGGTKIETIREKAQNGDAEAQFELGKIYNSKADYKEAVKWYRLAAEQGFAKGQNNLAVMYEKGHGVKQDYKKAAEWYHLAAEQGFAIPQHNLGWMYEKATE